MARFELRADAGPTLAASLQRAIMAWFEDVALFLIAGLAWTLGAGALLVAVTVTPLALAGLPLIGPLTGGLMAMAAVAVRGNVVRSGTFLAGVRDRFWTKTGLAGVQLAVLTVATLEIELVPAIGTELAGLAALIAVEAVAITSAYALVVWALLGDPERANRPVVQLFRTAVEILLTHPLGMVLLLALVVLCIAAASAAVVLAMMLPSLVALASSFYVLRAADVLER